MTKKMKKMKMKRNDKNSLNTYIQALTQTIGGAPRSAYVSKSEMARIFFKSNISLLPTHFDVWWDSLIKIEVGPYISAKRAVYILKRAMNIRKRALYFRKRALCNRKEPYAAGCPRTSMCVGTPS